MLHARLRPLALLVILIVLLMGGHADPAVAQGATPFPTPMTVLTPMAYPKGPPPVSTPMPVLVQATGAPTMEPPTEAPTPDQVPSTAPAESSPVPAEVPITQTEALWMLRLATGKDVPVNTLKGQTGKVLLDYQKANGIEANGTLDELTVEKLRAVVQESLHQLGHAGEFREALKDFQRERGLGVDGDLGRQTATTLASAINVRKYQELLQKAAGYAGPLNGRATDAELKTALEKYQKEHGLKVTGTLDEATRQALQGAAPKAASSPTPPPPAEARPWSPAWHWLGGFVTGVLTMIALMLAARRAGRH